ncbi:MAG: diphosphomevalonate decarboxylase [Bacteroidota bacterium]
MDNIVAWRSPSNIAIVKYWGKHGVQLPRNASLSFTLSKAYTDTQIQFSPKFQQSPEIELDFFFEGEPNKAFADKIRKFWSGIVPMFPFLLDYRFVVHSKNSFPHSAGIASSASSMSALALGLCQIEEKLLRKGGRTNEFWQKASHISRLGSGSACRSVYGGSVVWGATDLVTESSDEHAVALPESEVHSIFNDYQDTILIVSGSEKSVSSRAGHALMNTHPFAKLRFEQAHDNLKELLPALRTGDLEAFVKITEAEALMLHALMMTSDPSYLLLHPNTLNVIEKVRAFREETKIPICFTLDAGPNVHLLYPKSDRTKVLDFIKSDLAVFCEGGRWIEDEVGKGAEEVEM